MPENYFSNGKINDEKGVAEFTKNFVKESKISTPYVVAVLPETKTFIKTVEIPYYSKDVLEGIKKEIVANVPYKIEEMYFDWQKISILEKDKFLIGLAPKDIVDSSLKNGWFKTCCFRNRISGNY